jgi:hypothetical protein
MHLSQFRPLVGHVPHPRGGVKIPHIRAAPTTLLPPRRTAGRSAAIKGLGVAGRPALPAYGRTRCAKPVNSCIAAPRVNAPRVKIRFCRVPGAGRAVAPTVGADSGFSQEPLSGPDRVVCGTWLPRPAAWSMRWFRCCYRCLTYQRSMVSVCPFHDRVNCQQPGAGTSISEG